MSKKIDYKCSFCDTSSVKLWRKANFGRGLLICAQCLEKEGVSVNSDGKTYDYKIECLTDQVYSEKSGYWIPAVLSPCGGFWGYTSVPDSDADKWRNTPNKMQEKC